MNVSGFEPSRSCRSNVFSVVGRANCYQITEGRQEIECENDSSKHDSLADSLRPRTPVVESHVQEDSKGHERDDCESRCRELQRRVIALELELKQARSRSSPTINAGGVGQPMANLQETLQALEEENESHRKREKRQDSVAEFITSIRNEGLRGVGRKELNTLLRENEELKQQLEESKDSIWSLRVQSSLVDKERVVAERDQHRHDVSTLQQAQEALTALFREAQAHVTELQNQNKLEQDASFKFEAAAREASQKLEQAEASYVVKDSQLMETKRILVELKGRLQKVESELKVQKQISEEAETELRSIEVSNTIETEKSGAFISPSISTEAERRRRRDDILKIATSEGVIGEKDRETERLRTDLILLQTQYSGLKSQREYIWNHKMEDEATIKRHQGTIDHLEGQLKEKERAMQNLADTMKNSPDNPELLRLENENLRKQIGDLIARKGPYAPNAVGKEPTGGFRETLHLILGVESGARDPGETSQLLRRAPLHQANFYLEWRSRLRRGILQAEETGHWAATKKIAEEAASSGQMIPDKALGQTVRREAALAAYYCAWIDLKGSSNISNARRFVSIGDSMLKTPGELPHSLKKYSKFGQKVRDLINEWEGSGGSRCSRIFRTKKCVRHAEHCSCDSFNLVTACDAHAKIA
jgi:regulator of replication initiation timing